MLNRKSLLITGGRIIDPAQGRDGPGSVLVEDGAIEWLGPEGADLPEGDYEVMNVPGMIVCPGFIDLHCHLREPGDEAKETIRTGARAAARGGFTTICCMPNTDPPIDTVTMVKYIRKRAAEEAVIRVLPIGCVTRRRKGNALVAISRLAAAGAVGFSDDGSPVSRNDLMQRALEICRAPGTPVIDHCEDLTLADAGVINEGIIARQFGLRGIPNAAEEKMVARDLELARKTGGRLHLAHISTAGSVGLIRKAKAEGLQVTCEVTPHHLTLKQDEVIHHGAMAKVNPPLRMEKDRVALVLGLVDDVIDCIATDHAPHTAADKDKRIEDAAFGISGFETALGSLMRLVHAGEISLEKVIAKLTIGPAKILGGKFSKLGTLAIGAPADITIFSPHEEWLVESKRFVSKGHNTPLEGALLKGKVIATVYNGNIVYRDNMPGRKPELKILRVNINTDDRTIQN